MRLTLRTLLAYIDDTLDPTEARRMGRRVAQTEYARELVDRIKRVTRRRGLFNPPVADGEVSDPNVVAEYLSDTLPADQVAGLEEALLESDVHLAEVAACHQILTVVLTEPVRVPPPARQRMYKLVQGPAADPNRRPGAGGALTGVTMEVPPLASQPEEADATFLLGMPRYSFSRMGVVGVLVQLAVAFMLLLILAVGVFMALPHGPAALPEVARAPQTSAPVVPVPTPTPDPDRVRPPADTDPKPADPKPADPKPVEKPEAKKEPDPKPADPKPADPVKLPDRPLAGDLKAGVLESADKDAVALVRRPDGTWARLVSGAQLKTNLPVVALPGYKAEVKLDSAVTVRLWGNTPPQMPEPPPVFESRVQFHPPVGFDADLTVEAGRVYLAAGKAGAKARVRAGDEVWDVTLPADAEVAAQVTADYPPGVAAEGESPQVVAFLAVTRGEVSVAAPARARTFARQKAPAVFRWDNKTGRLDGPLPDARPTYFAPTRPEPAPPPIANALAKFAEEFKDADKVKTQLSTLYGGQIPGMTAQAREFGEQLAVLCYAAIDDPAPLVEAVNDPARLLRRKAAVAALRHWVALAPENPARFRSLLTDKLGLSGDQAATAAKLLRGFGEDELKEAKTFSDLVAAMADPAVCVRELAFINVEDLYLATRPEGAPPDKLLLFDAGAPPEQRERALAQWKRKVEDVRKKFDPEVKKKTAPEPRKSPDADPKVAPPPTPK